MRVVILNGNPVASNTAFDNYVCELTKILCSRKHVVNSYVLRDIDVHNCVGCFSCWVKTPGECPIKDGTNNICRHYITADLVLFASPVIMGFVSAILRKVQEKLLPLLHPYFEFRQNEVHHLSRYKRYPLIALLLEGEVDTDEEDIEIITSIYQRFSLNLKSDLVFTHPITVSTSDIADAIDSL